MSWVVFYKLLAIFLAVAIGWFVGRMRWLGEGGDSNDPARVLSAAAFYIFVPALLFRTTARLDTEALPWRTVFAFFVPTILVMLAVYHHQKRRRAPGAQPADPSVRAIAASFGNTLQVGVPVAAAVFGEAGLGIHLTVVSVHALTLLSVLTTLVELDLARARADTEPSASAWRTLRSTARNTLIHPVVLPVVAGLLYNYSGLPLPAVIDETLQVFGTAVVPLCLTLIGMSLAYLGWPRQWRGALGLVLVKLLVLPAVVLPIAHWGFGIDGLPLQVIVMVAALPGGSNVLIFAQRYGRLESEATATIVLGTLLFMLTAPLWLTLLHVADF